jgi:hypothetical protein
MIFRQSDKVGVGVIWHYFHLHIMPCYSQEGGIISATILAIISTYKSKSPNPTAKSL